MKELLEKLITVYNKTHKGQLFIKNDILFHANIAGFLKGKNIMTIEQLIANANATTCRKNPLYLEEHEGDTYICRKGVQDQFIDLDSDIVPQFKAIYNRFRTFETLPKRLKKTAWMNQEAIFVLFKGHNISIKPLDIITVEVSYNDECTTCYSPDILKTLKKMIP